MISPRCFFLPFLTLTISLLSPLTQGGEVPIDLTVTPDSPSDHLQWFLGTDLEAVFWAADSPAPGLLKFSDDTFFSPRLSVRLDALLNSQWYYHSNVRIDRGFDPGDEPDGEIRLDEVFLRYRPLTNNQLNFQIGKFATSFGSWVQQHDFHDDPFLIPPIPYGQVIGIGVQSVGSLAPSNIEARANRTIPGIFETPKRNWASTIWGPSYSSGFSAFGTLGKFDYSVEIKNAGLSSHPDVWDPSINDFESPTFSGRLGYRPDASWALGLSFSRGPYLDPEAEPTLPAGFDRGDLPHTLLGFDARWSHGDFVFSGEVIASEFETLEAGDLRSLSWHLQARWKAAPGFWLGSRFGQTINNRITDSNGDRIVWSPNLWRLECSLGWRITPDLLFKSQYAFTNTEGGGTVPGEHLFASGFGWRF